MLEVKETVGLIVTGKSQGEVRQDGQTGLASRSRLVLVVKDSTSLVLNEHNGRPLYGPIPSTYAKGAKCNLIASKALLRKDSCSKKKDDSNRNQIEIVDWGVKLSNSLATEGVIGSSSGTQNNISLVVHDNNEVQWIKNSTFERDSQSNLQ
ncbi:hypothetical protein V6N13_125077 [Hibiscus sabdariffa]|uniref:Uncharacterized protein n=1 Tax=Hibiscus sabdariffa TaxID=183260 RepID=A0ABR2U4L8_9ROSI